MKSFLGCSIIALCAVGLFNCGSPPTDEEMGDTGDDSEALSISGCNAGSLLAAAPNAERRAIIQRALKWVSDGVLYSQTATHEGYRRDCSGFVSMAWQEAKPGASTAGLAPYDTSISKAISWSEIQTGDAVNVRAGAHHHVMLWGMWLDKAKTQACIIQENHTGTPANIKAYAASYVKTYNPIRAKGIAAASSSAPDPSADDPAGTDDPAATDPGSSSGGTDPSAGGSSGAASGHGSCSSDGACNPGSDGAGLICVSGQCVPGCRNNSQCPGSTTCSGGQCR